MNYRTLGAFALLLLLVGCQVSFDLVPVPGLVLRNASYRTNVRATVDGRERFIICDNRTTTLSYSFDYTGALLSWRSYLRGRNTGTIRGDRRFTLADVVRPGRVEVTYTIPPYQAPLSVNELPDAAAIAPESIIVVPRPTVVGASELRLEVNGIGRSVVLSGRDPIPVVDNCP